MLKMSYINSTFFQNMVILHIQLKGMKNTITCNQLFCPYTHSLVPWLDRIFKNGGGGGGGSGSAAGDFIGLLIYYNIN